MEESRRRAGPGSRDAEGLTVAGVEKSYGKEKVLRGVSFSVPRGCALGICGSNGAGKSTLIHLVASILRPDRGSISFMGIPASRARAYRAQVGFVPQEIALSPRLTVRQNLEFWAAMNGLSGARGRKAAAAAAERANIGAFLHKRVAGCSGGMARRANLAAGLIGDPRLILLDEPTAGIDEESREMILLSVTGLRAEGRVILMVNHYRQELEAVCDRVITLREGLVAGGGNGSPRGGA